MDDLVTADQFDGERRTERKFFQLWKRVAWWRVVRVKKGRKALKDWVTLAKRTSQNRASKAKATEFFAAWSGRRGIASWLEGHRRRETARRKQIMAKAANHHDVKRAASALKAWKSAAVRSEGLRSGAVALGLFYEVKYLKLRCFRALRGHSLAFEQVHGARAVRVFTMLRANIAEQRRLRTRREAGRVHGDCSLARRGLAMLGRYVVEKQAFRERILRALAGNQQTILNRCFARWFTFTEKALDRKEEQAIVAGLVYCRYLTKVCFKVLKKHWSENMKIRRGFNKFALFKAKKALLKLKKYARVRQLLKGFTLKATSQGEDNLKRKCFLALKSRWEVTNAGREFNEALALKVKRERFKHWRNVHLALSHSHARQLNKLSNVFTNWSTFARSQKAHRLKLTSFYLKFKRKKILRGVKIHGKALYFFAHKCGRAWLEVVFGQFRVVVRDLLRRKRLLLAEFTKVRDRKKAEAFSIWRGVTDTLRWQSECLSYWTGNRLGLVFNLWRTNAVHVRRDRIMCEAADVECDKRRVLGGLGKLLKNRKTRHFNRKSTALALRCHSRRLAKKLLVHWQAFALRKIKKRSLLQLGQSHFDQKSLTSGIAHWNRSMYAGKLYRVARSASYFMYRKGYILLTFKLWKASTRSKLILKSCVRQGLILMQVLAFKRWRGGALGVKFQKRFLRRVWKAWASFVTKSLSLVHFGIQRRFFIKFRRVASRLASRNRVLRHRTSQVVLLRKRNAFNSFQRGYLASNFYARRGQDLRVTRLLKHWRTDAKNHADFTRRLGEWLASGEARSKSSAGPVVYRVGLHRFSLRKAAVGRDEVLSAPWIGDVRKQQLFVAFSGLKGWYVTRVAEGRLNERALVNWRECLLRRTVQLWRSARHERLNDEQENETALDKWYTVLVQKAFKNWVTRTGYFRGLREEASFNKMRAGFDDFVCGTMRNKVLRCQRDASFALRKARNQKVLTLVFQAWEEHTMFERQERRFRRERESEKNLKEITFLTWRMYSKVKVLPRLVHKGHHESRFTEHWEADIRNELANASRED